MTFSTIKPWTRWWWMGNAVNKAEITRHLEAYADAGIGGVEVTPIYGVPSRKSEWIPFLSDDWMRMLEFTVSECNRLKMGCDLDLGSGWPWGGPMITNEFAPKNAEFEIHQAGDCIKGDIVAAVTMDADGKRYNVTNCLDKVPAGQILVVMKSVPNGQQVKRAAPGGEGNVMCPYSRAALDVYLDFYDELFARFPAALPYSTFYDSFEYNAFYSDDFPMKFAEVNDYLLTDRLPELAGIGDPDIINCVRADYRYALHRCLLDNSVIRWTEHSHEMGITTRYQAHGAPGNLLDLYAAADIPETEVFGASTAIKCKPLTEDALLLPPEYQLVNRLAASAAHLTGKSLASSETFTWHREHFRGTPEDMKYEADLLWTTGINHLFFHGSTYSPADAVWPGWLFYASTQVDIADPLWVNLPAFNSYAADVQDLLQQGKPSNDILVYVPWFDLYAMPGEELFRQYTVHANVQEWVADHEWGRWSLKLQNAGYGIDFVSDDLLNGCETRDGWIVKDGNRWQTIMVPPCAYMPIATIEKLNTLAASGVKIIVGTPNAVSAPGMRGTDIREKSAFSAGMSKLTANAQMAEYDNLCEILNVNGVKPIYSSDTLLYAIRREHDNGDAWFITNLSDSTCGITEPLVLYPRQKMDAVVIIDAVAGRRGLAKSVDGVIKINSTLLPGQSLLVCPAQPEDDTLPAWRQYAATDEVVFNRTVNVEFLSGGPSLPSTYSTDKIEFWTSRIGQGYRDFSGTARYTFEMEWNGHNYEEVLLQFTEIAASAKITINGEYAGVVWCKPYQLFVGKFLRRGINKIEVEVTNTAANRISAMDRAGEDWRVYGDINFVTIHYTPFDASDWATTPSGINGDVKLVGML